MSKLVKTWIVRGQYIEERVYGALWEGLRNALTMAAIESEYPTKVNNPISITIHGIGDNEEPLRVTLTLCYQRDEVKNGH